VSKYQGGTWAFPRYQGCVCLLLQYLFQSCSRGGGGGEQWRTCATRPGATLPTQIKWVLGFCYGPLAPQINALAKSPLEAITAPNGKDDAEALQTPEEALSGAAPEPPLLSALAASVCMGLIFGGVMDWAKVTLPSRTQLQIPAVLFCYNTLGSSSAYMTLSSQVQVVKGMRDKAPHWSSYRLGIGYWWQAVYVLFAILGAFITSWTTGTNAQMSSPRGFI
jgi:hypothetical protein